jgi:hypothetical protein
VVLDAGSQPEAPPARRIAMRTCALPMLAVIPWIALEDAFPERPAPCAIAIELQVRAPVVWGYVEWQLLVGEVTRIWAPYGVTFCWDRDGESCRGVEVRLRVLLAQDPPAPPRAAAPSLLGWIWFRGNEPGTDIVLSANGARTLVSRARLGDRPLGDWSRSLVDDQVPRALARALAHEIGHFVLRDRAHTARGLMASSFTPYELAFAPLTAFRLPPSSSALVQRACVAAGLRAQHAGEAAARAAGQ